MIVEPHFMMTREEATWLRDLMQNPIYDDETRYESLMRKKIFIGMKAYVDALDGKYNITNVEVLDDIPF